ncbi:MAG: potassium channel protein [Flavobacteriaceae bacterium]|nr:potassium channel protein [Flavobacteriaceae bacterium]
MVIILAIMLMSIGVLGYIFIGNYSFIEALYMTVITISTVGFSEVRPLNDSEKVFTILLILTSITIFGYIISVITEFISNGHFLEELKYKKMQKKINKLEKHTIICGYGRNGRQAIIKLTNNNEPCVVIEDNENLIKKIEENRIPYIKGDATNDIVLKNAGIKNAKYLITTLPRDADNLYVVLSARQLNNKMTIISRASKETSESKLRIAGANNVIMPDRLGGNHMASLVVSPDIIEFIDKLSLNGDCDTNLQEISVNELPEKFHNKNLLTLDLRKKTGCSVIGYKSPKNKYIVNPDPKTKLIPNSKLIILGKMKQINKLKELF